MENIHMVLYGYKNNGIILLEVGSNHTREDY